MNLRDLAVCDFETLGIQDRPYYPPHPVGVALRVNGKSRYWAWGHITGQNNCTFNEAKAELERVCSKYSVLFHNEKFDAEILRVTFGITFTDWKRTHDTLPLLFLRDPRATTFSLKPSAEVILGEPPAERDAVEDWLIENQPVPGVRISKSKGSEHNAGRYIAYAPAELVGPYAIGDVDRTFHLFEKLLPEIEARNMRGAYDREQRLLPHILEMERNGIRVDQCRLNADCESYSDTVGRVDEWLFKRFKCPPFNVESGEELAQAMVKAGVTTAALLGLTATGKMATNKDALRGAVKDKQITAMLQYRSQLLTCLKLFMYKWRDQAEQSGGLIFTTWHSTRNDKGRDGAGARTGRLSSTPNMQNVINILPLWEHEDKGLPKCPIKLPSLPIVRSYIVPMSKGEDLIQRDWTQQEPRILAHFCGGSLQQMYIDDPWVDFHDQAMTELKKVGLTLTRKVVKTFNLGTIYGQGIGLLAEKSGLDYETAKGVKTALQNLYPGLKEIYREARLRAATNTPIRTWGGREYHVEPPKIINGKFQQFDYKLPNCLIQGSAADSNKESLIRFCERKRPSWKVILTIHDEIVVSVPRKERRKAMLTLKQAMEVEDFDVPMLSEGKYSSENFHALKDWDKRGVLV